MGENILRDPALVKDAYERRRKLILDIIKFNSNIDGQYYYRPDTNRLYNEGRLQANPKARIDSADKLNIKEKNKNRKSLGLDY